ncbi:MAG: c-type cytochrome [Gemmatimonadaceae bacterium]
MHTVRLYYAIAGIVAALVHGDVLLSQSGPKKAVPDTSAITEQMITEGRSVFRGHGGCTVCHGQNLEGVVGPTLKAHAWKDAKNGDIAEIVRVITQGVPGTVMVAHPNGVTDAQINAVAAYVWAVSRGKAKP